MGCLHFMVSIFYPSKMCLNFLTRYEKFYLTHFVETRCMHFLDFSEKMSTNLSPVILIKTIPIKNGVWKYGVVLFSNLNFRIKGEFWDFLLQNCQKYDTHFLNFSKVIGLDIPTPEMLKSGDFWKFWNFRNFHYSERIKENEQILLWKRMFWNGKW